MTSMSVTFENGALSEAIKRVIRVAPKSGEAFDKASGIVIETNPAWGMVLIKATNLSIYYSEWVTAVSVSGDASIWRVSSEIFSQVVTKLPVGSGKAVTLSEEEGKLHIKSGRFKAAIGIIKAGYYPDWSQFDPEGTQPVNDLGSRIEQVAWAVTKGLSGEAISGIRFNGSTLVATDKYRVACVPCAAPHIEGEVVIPPSVLSSLVSPSGPTKIGVSGDQLFIAPNDFTQIRCIVYGGTFLKVENVMHRDHPASINVNRTEFLESVGRVSSADAKNRLPEMSLFIGNEAIAFYMEDSSGGDKIIDQIDYLGQALHERFRIFVTPASLIDAMTAAPDDSIELFYDTSNKMKVLYLKGSNGYEAWIAPRSGTRRDVE